MALILLIETSTALCSVALSKDGEIVASRRDSSRSHASLTAVFCDEVLREASVIGAGSVGSAGADGSGAELGVSARLDAVCLDGTGAAAGLDAVCISEGPGSYTGLRVGLSTAKGICFGTGAKLLSVSSLDVLAAMAAAGSSDEDGAVRTEGESVCGSDGNGTVRADGEIVDGSVGRGTIVPMIDARRMEVYTANYSKDGARQSPIEAKVIDSESVASYGNDCIFIGDGAMKCREVIGHGRFIDACPDAAYMGRLAEQQYRLGAFRDLAYFEPFYLKDFVVTTSKKKLF